MPKTKSFRVAVEGDTVDGRKIERSWIQDIVATSNRTTYGARVNMEHIRGITNTAPFKAYGDVLSVSSQEIDLELGGKTEKKLALYAEIEATDELVAMNRDKQKIYTSIEVQPNFANTGKAYLVGLAATDSPASLGTDVLSFAAKNPLPQLPRPQQEGNVFSIGMETAFALADGEQAPPTEAQGFFAAGAAFFNKLLSKDADAVPPVVAPTPPLQPVTPAPANDNEAKFAAMVAGVGEMTKGFAALETKLTTELSSVRAEITTVKASIETTPERGQPQRRAATGGDGQSFATDC